MRSIAAKHQLTLDDLVVGRKNFQRSRTAHLLVSHAITILCIGYVLWDPIIAGDTASIFTVPVLIVAGLIAYLITAKLLSPYLKKREFAKRPDANLEIAYLFSGQQISISSLKVNSETQWSAYSSVFSSRSGFLFLLNAQVFYFIPRRAFKSEADFEALKALARAHATAFKELN